MARHPSHGPIGPHRLGKKRRPFPPGFTIPDDARRCTYDDPDDGSCTRVVAQHGLCLLHAQRLDHYVAPFEPLDPDEAAYRMSNRYKRDRAAERARARIARNPWPRTKP